MAETFKSDEEYIFKAEFNEDYGLQFIPTGESVVRCKDCKFLNRYYDVQVIGSCSRHGCIYNKRETDFCSWGERKDEVEE